MLAVKIKTISAAVSLFPAITHALISDAKAVKRKAQQLNLSHGFTRVILQSMAASQVEKAGGVIRIDPMRRPGRIPCASGWRNQPIRFTPPSLSL